MIFLQKLMLSASLLCVGLIATAAQPQAKGGSQQTLKALVKKRIGKVDSIEVSSFLGDFNGDGQDDALTVSYYHVRDGGNSDSIDVSLYVGTATGFRFVKTVPNVFGQSPRAAKFSRGEVRITLTTLGPDDSRCCPSEPKQYVIATP